MARDFKMKTCDLQIGDRVSLERWDGHERPGKRLGECVVTLIYRAQCETGWMVEIKCKDGRSMPLDRNWLKKI